MKDRLILSLLITLLSSVVVAPVKAVIVMTIEEQGSGVVIEYSGSLNNWSRLDTRSIAGASVNSQGLFNSTASSSGSTQVDSMLPGSGGGMLLNEGAWTSILTDDGLGTGDPLAWSFSSTYAPLGYTAGDQLTGSVTFNNTDLTTMGFTPGASGTWAGTAGTVNFSVAAIPEPNSYGFLLGAAGLATAIFFRRRRRSSAV